MAERTRQSRMAIVAETTEGTPAFPASGADFLALQEGFSVALGFESLENAELKASLGKSKPISGIDIATASVQHYLRASGTEGTAPQSGYSKLLKAAFGQEELIAVEQTAAASSTTILVKVASTTANKIGQALLVKHAAFPWEITVIKEVVNATDLSLLFALNNAPATGTSLGKAVMYRAADSGHPTLSVHDYRGNGGAYQLAAGCRVTSFTAEAAAGELINGSFELEGIAGYFDPIRILAADTKLDFNETGPTLRAATIAAGVYKTPHHLAQAISDAMNAVATDTITVSYSNSTGKFTISTGGTLLSLLWSTGVNAANTIGDKIGFVTASDDTGSLTYTSDNAQDWSSPYTPAFDSPGDPVVAKNGLVLIGSQSENVCAAAQDISYELGVPVTQLGDVCAESGVAGTVINGREVKMSGTLTLSRHDAKLFEAMRSNTGISALWAFGSKSGGNFIAGKSGSLHIKECVVSSHELGDNDGLVTIAFELAGFVNSSGSSETALNLV